MYFFYIYQNHIFHKKSLIIQLWISYYLKKKYLYLIISSFYKDNKIIEFKDIDKLK
jgi:hypothetical protein